MTVCNRPAAARQVIVHGDCWPVVTAMAHVVKSALPGSTCSTTYTLPALLQQLSRQPEAALVLCLHPREHIFLFYALKNELLYHPALVISDELLFSDRVILHSWGDIPATGTGAVAMIQHGTMPHPAKGKLADFLSDPKPATGIFAVPQIFTTRERLMNYMSLLMYRASVGCGVTQSQQKLLQEVHRGRHTLAGMTGILNTGTKKIWQDKERLLSKMGMRNRLRELLFGTRFRDDLQRTVFMVPAGADMLYTSEAFAGDQEILRPD
ncbi:transcriptional regulator [Salmonella enterica subsp. enterica serovar Newport]|uniref:Transcriptional regulator n=1 Tax=Salmonella newport TaxID=108619 RepID=A0A5W8IV71_SALNE|nr:transcriptional regulator [Salmonella enterica subsp. enterica serovar Newport]EHU7139087.1 transcriptional regulator [Salmonella enterica]EBQ9422324.1 transcriptional regulator [Salmonella enterica subsp. enterica serovar Newport]EBS1164825.1 transcriptional regulator [Salmonella enterica subsp. enterica serovar Newport]EBS6022082.1 transcriptional regulator [Salmonella enterica subsp. enterica serovar Newport]